MGVCITESFTEENKSTLKVYTKQNGQNNLFGVFSLIHMLEQNNQKVGVMVDF